MSRFESLSPNVTSNIWNLEPRISFRIGSEWKTGHIHPGFQITEYSTILTERVPIVEYQKMAITHTTCDNTCDRTLHLNFKKPISLRLADCFCCRKEVW